MLPDTRMYKQDCAPLCVQHTHTHAHTDTEALTLPEAGFPKRKSASLCQAANLRESPHDCKENDVQTANRLRTEPLLTLCLSFNASQKKF